MVAVLTRVFGFEHLPTIEDAVQDTFIKAIAAWRKGVPDNPEAWLTQAAKHRCIDLFRKLKSEQERAQFFEHGTASIALSELFLDEEVKDSQLRMIFTACHPSLDPRDQISFALKTIAGFSQREIASALLMKEESVKKRLQRARKSIMDAGLAFEIPQGPALMPRLARVQEVLYLLFNEGFHSGQRDTLVRQELCGEALRMCTMLKEQPGLDSPETYALFALMCFHSARLESKVSDEGDIIDLMKQDRERWYVPLIMAGHDAMMQAVKTAEYSSYHYEAAIASEHLRAKTFEDTDWEQIIHWYAQLEDLAPSPMNKLSMAVAHIHRSAYHDAREMLESIEVSELGKRNYLYHGCWAEYYKQTNARAKALEQYDLALDCVSNELERRYIERKRQEVTKAIGGA